MRLATTEKHILQRGRGFEGGRKKRTDRSVHWRRCVVCLAEEGGALGQNGQSPFFADRRVVRRGRDFEDGAKKGDRPFCPLASVCSVLGVGRRRLGTE